MEINTGYYRFVVYQNVLFIEAFSVWNQTIAREGLLCFTDLVFEYYINKRWAIFADIKNCNLNIPRPETVLKDIFNGITILPTHVAHVVGNSKKQKWKVNKPIRTKGDLLISFFSTKKEAEAWLDLFGYRMFP
ncbi:MAG: hypothetical protein HUN04_06090 [Desulfobacter sp.]|nr:MAG: hypothetical protein HUN04_06090 [Desulfobacter sp.]